MPENLSEEKGKSVYKLFGLPWYFFAILAVVVVVTMALGILPKGMIGALVFMIILGTILNEIGNHLPIVRSYLGGGPIIIIFGSAALVYFGILNSGTVKIVNDFMKTDGFLDFYIAALITGSILGMNRKLLIKAVIRYIPAILGGVVCALGLGYLVGAMTGYGGAKAMMFISLPIMGGGMGAGAVPLSQIFASQTGESAEKVLSVMVPAVAMGNAMAIICGGLLNRLGKKHPSLTGNGQMMVSSANDSSDIDKDNSKSKAAVKLENLGIGLLLATTFFCFGAIINKFIPVIHSYAWMIIAVVIVKITGMLPEKFEICCYQWFQFIMVNLTTTLLVGIGISYTDLGQVIEALSGKYLIIVIITVLGAIIGSGFVGKLVGFYPIESSITAGLCMANMGGTGDVAVLSAANRMELMPFGQISSRLGGAFMLVIASALLHIFVA